MTKQATKREQGDLRNKFFFSAAIVIFACVSAFTLLWVCRLQNELARVNIGLQNNKASINLLKQEFFPEIENDELNAELEESRDAALHFRSKRGAPNGKHKRGRMQYCHLTGTNDFHDIAAGTDQSKFRWDSDSEVCNMNVLPTSRDSYPYKIKIFEKGFYFVYAQLVFYDCGEKEIGFQIVKERNNVPVDVLLLSVTTPNRANTRFGLGNALKHAYSGYTAGMFLLKPGDFIYVEPKEEPRDVDFRMGDKESFFGVFKLK